MNHAATYDALMLDYAAGALPAASALVVETHLSLRPAATAHAAAAEALGGAMLEGAPPAPVASRPALAGRGAEALPAPHLRAARGLIDAVRHDPNAVPWNALLFGVRERALPVPGLSLLRLTGGGALPRHGHTGDELTLVLHGRYEDESGAYAPGDIAFADETADHRPHVPRGEDCVCLIARSGDMQFRGLLGFLVSIWPASPETKSQA